MNPIAVSASPRGVVRETRAVLRASLSSVMATIVDGAVYQGLLFVRAENYGTWAFFGALAGAVTNFSLNYYWAFSVGDALLAVRVFRYVVTSTLTFLGVRTALWFLIEVLSTGVRVSWLPAQLLAFLLISYPLQRLWVFRGGRT